MTGLSVRAPMKIKNTRTLAGEDTMVNLINGKQEGIKL